MLILSFFFLFLIVAGLPIVDGIKGTRKILEGAISKYHSLSYHEYAKLGGYDAALRDFRALKPKNVKTEVHDNVVCYTLGKL